MERDRFREQKILITLTCHPVIALSDFTCQGSLEFREGKLLLSSRATLWTQGICSNHGNKQLANFSDLTQQKFFPIHTIVQHNYSLLTGFLGNFLLSENKGLRLHLFCVLHLPSFQGKQSTEERQRDVRVRPRSGIALFCLYFMDQNSVLWPCLPEMERLQ